MNLLLESTQITIPNWLFIMILVWLIIEGLKIFSGVALWIVTLMFPYEDEDDEIITITKNENWKDNNHDDPDGD